MTDPQTIINLGVGGTALNGQNGSSSSSDSNDARFLGWPGDNAGNYVYLTGVTGNYLSVPDEAALDITGDIDVRLRIAMDDWTPSQQRLLSKWRETGNQRSYLLSAGGALTFFWSPNGTTSLSHTASTAVPFVDGSVGWVRTTLDVNNGAGGYDLKFFTSDTSDGSTWTQLGTTFTGGTTTSIFAGTELVEIGSRTGGIETAAGKFYRAIIMNGIAGTTVLDVNTSAVTSGANTSFPAATGQTVTINRSSAGRKSVAVVSPVYLLGTDDRIEVLNSDLLNFSDAQSFTLVTVVRQWDTIVNNAVHVAKLNSSDHGYLMRVQTGNVGPRGFNVRVEDTGNTAIQNMFSPQTAAASTLRVQAFTYDTTANTGLCYMNAAAGTAVSVSTVGTISNTNSLFFGFYETAGTYQDFEFIAGAVFRRALSASEVQTITNLYQNRLS